MAAAQSSMELLQRRVSEVSICPICLENLDNAKSLPCLHTFCLQCLKSYWKNTRAGQRVTCPVCRNPLNIPSNGLDSLPTNFIVQNLMEVSCSQSNVSDGTPCEEHPDKRLELYCFNCEVAICRKCQATKHRQHNCHDIKEVSAEFAKSLETATKPVLERAEEFRSSLDQFERKDWQCRTAVQAVDVAVRQRGEQLKITVDYQVGELLEQLRQAKSEDQKQQKSRRDALELALSEMRSFADSSLELRTKGSPCDITREAGALRDRATQLLATYAISDEHDAGHVPTFFPMNLDEFTQEGQNIIGRLQRNTDKSQYEDAKEKEIRPQTKRERELELQLTCIIRRLKSRTDRVMEEQKKLQAESEQAAAKLRSTEGQRSIEKEWSQSILLDAQRNIFDLKTKLKKEREIIVEHRTVCDRISADLSVNVLSEDFLEAMRSQDAAPARIRDLEEKTRLALEEHDSIKVLIIRRWTRVDVLESEVRNAFDREKELHRELNKIAAREAVWKDTASMSGNRMSKFQDECRYLLERQDQLRTIISVKQWKEENIMTSLNDSSLTVLNYLSMAKNRERIFQEGCKMSSDRVNTLQQEISQVAKRQLWMDELRSACETETSVHELFQQTSVGSDLLKKQLQQILKIEESLLERLQRSHEREKLLVEELKTTYESVHNIREQTEPMWNEFENVQELIYQFEKETKLQEQLKEIRQRESWLEEYSEYMLSKEQELRNKLNLLSDREQVFRIPLTQLKYRDSPMNEVQVLTADDGAQVRGMTSANGKLFVLHYRNGEGQISVYSTTDFAFLRRFSVPDLSEHGIQDMKARSDGTDYVTMYIADSDNRCVHKVVEVDKKCSVVKQSLSGKPLGLSVLSIGFPLVTLTNESLFAGTDKVVELYGSLESCRVVPKFWYSSLWHTVQLRSGGYVISYRGCWCARGSKIGVVNDDGIDTKSYGNQWTSEENLIKGACQVAVDDDDFIFVADNAKNRVVLLNPSLEFVRYINTRNRPRWLHVDAAERRLFIGHDSNAVSIIQLRKAPSEESL